jgi:hypothetical protein
VDGVADAQPVYLAVQAKRHEAYPQAGVRGQYLVVEGCALLDDDLLIFPFGTVPAPTTAGQTPILFGGNPGRRLLPGMTVLGGGGWYPLSHFTDPDAGWPLQAPVPERCRRLTDQAVVIAPGAEILPASRFADRLYAAVQARRLEPGPLAPVGGTLRVENQCLLLGDALLVLPAESSIGFAADGSLEVRITSSQYLETIAARPGDRIMGSGGGLMAESEAIPAMPRPLVEPIPERCRPLGRRGVMLNPGPTVTRGTAPTYADPGAGGTFVVPPASPPPPVSDPADCPPGSKLFHGLCRDAQGRTVRAKNAR